MKSVELGSLAEIGGGWRGKDAGTEVRLVRTTDMSGGEIDWTTTPTCSTPSDPNRLLRHGDILVARTGAGSVGKVALVQSPPPSVANENLLWVRPIDTLDSAYLVWFLRTTEGRRQLESRAVGSVMPNISAKRLATIRIPHNDLAKQIRIASSIDEASRSQRSASASLTRAQSSLREARRGVWAMAVAAAPRPTHDWPTEAIGDIATVRDTDRIALNATQRSARPGGTPYYGASGIIDWVDGYTHEGVYLLISEDGQNLETRATDIAMVSYGRIWANNHIHVLAMSDVILPEFAAAYLNSIDLRDFLTGTTQPKLPLNRLRGVRIPVPHLHEQERLVGTISEITTTLEGWSRSLEQAIAAMERAWQTFLNRLYDQEVEASIEPDSPTNANAQRRERTLPDLSYPTIEAALSAHPDGLTPEQLFAAVELEGSDTAERVDSFYQKLRQLVAEGRVNERRVEKSVVLVTV